MRVFSEPHNINEYKYGLFFVLCLFNLIDIVLSCIFMEYDISLEANPLMAYVFTDYGYWGLIVTNVAVLGFLFFLLPYVKEWVLWGLNFIMAGICVMGYVVASGVVNG